MNPFIKAVRSNTIQWRSIAFSVSNPPLVTTTRRNNLACSTALVNSKSNRNSWVGYYHDGVSFSHCISHSSKPILHRTAIMSSKVRQYTTISRAIFNRSLVKATHLSDSSMNRSLLLLSRRSMASTMKKRRTKMNKHKLRKRRKLMKLNTKISRE